MVVVHSSSASYAISPAICGRGPGRSRALLDGSISAVVATLSPTSKSASCPHTPKEFRHYVRPLQPEGTTLFQIFVCATVTDDGTCFEGWVNCVTEGESWLVRTVHFAWTDMISPIQRRTILSEVRSRKMRTFSDAHGDDEEDDDDAEDYQDEDEDEDDSAREGRQHLPVKGLKLLGYPVQGKYYNSSSEECEACEASGASNDVTHNKWCMLVQLGTQEEDNPLYTTGNIFLQQCTMHPNVFEAVCSGNW
ncbi:hypothetical protein BD414DRAFT_541342 [Trametes punicea]|nr:hypothetical protein BD414DRAFT_541342 [Trametes punicea]